MKLNKKVNLQGLVEKNGKIFDLNKIGSNLREYEEYHVLSEIIRNISQNNEIKRILIIGNELISIFSHLRLIFPKAQFYIASKSKDIVKSFKEHYRNKVKYILCILDVLNGVSLHDFIYNNSPFDLVIANKIYSKVKKKKKYLSTKFLYKFYLQQYGKLCLINYIQDSKKEILKLSESIYPSLEKKIPVNKEKNFIQFLIYTKNHK